MKKARAIFSAYLIIGLSVLSFTAQTGSAQQQPQRRQQQQGARNEREIRRVLQDLGAKVDDFRYRLSNDGNANRAADLSRDLRDLQDNLRALETKFNNRRENTQDVEALLDAAGAANESVSQNRLSGRNATDWVSIKTSFGQLAASYNINFNWDDNSISSNSSNDDSYSSDDNQRPNINRQPKNFPAQNGNSSGLTGTYKLDASRSENAGEIADRAVGGDAQARQDLMNKLETPDEIALDVRGNQISVASSRAPQITFTADGREQSQTAANGGNVRVRSTLRGQELTVSKMGGGDEDYTVTFASVDNGRGLRVTRRVTTDYLNETVFAESYYTKTDSVARLGINNDSNDSYSSSDSDDNRNYPNSTNGGNSPNGNSNGNYPTTSNGRTGSFIVGSGTILTGTLQNDISTKFSQNNDRFRLNVTAPNEFRGAVLEGRLSGLSRSGTVSGRSQITFNFETIRLSNGQTYDFAGFLQSVTDASGKLVKVDTEGTARGDNQTKETVKRGGIGAGIGAVIGAIAGGAQGAAIGAVIGGGAGAGSVVVQGKDDLDLKAGSSITVQSSSPSR